MAERLEGFTTPFFVVLDLVLDASPAGILGLAAVVGAAFVWLG